jgi:hypothetical protein
MKITLELWCDQSGINEDTNSSVWEFKLNGHPFPNSDCSIVSLDAAHKIVNKLIEIEQMMFNIYD